jgi:putative hemolysin
MDDNTFSYATLSDFLAKRWFIRLVELLTGQPKLERLYRRNQAYPRFNESFWQASVRSLDVDVDFEASAVASIPKSGPVVFVANHPFGVLDGIVACWLVEKVRSDFRVLVHSALMHAPEVRPYFLPIDFSGSEAARATNLATRAAARSHLDQGGALIVFPAGMISTSPDWLGRRPAVDARWQPFVAQLVQRSKASVVPIWFEGQNSWGFQLASHLNATLRLALIFHEVRARMGSTLQVVVGKPIPFESLKDIEDRQNLVDALYAATYGLASRQFEPRTAQPESRSDAYASVLETGRRI